MVTSPVPRASKPQIAAPVLANVAGEPADAAFDEFAAEALPEPDDAPGVVDVVLANASSPSAPSWVIAVVDVVVDEGALVDDGIEVVDVEGGTVVAGAAVVGVTVVEVVVTPTSDVVVSDGGSVVDVVVSTEAHPIDGSYVPVS